MCQKANRHRVERPLDETRRRERGVIATEATDHLHAEW